MIKFRNSLFVIVSLFHLLHFIHAQNPTLNCDLASVFSSTSSSKHQTAKKTTKSDDRVSPSTALKTLLEYSWRLLQMTGENIWTTIFTNQHKTNEVLRSFHPITLYFPA